MTLIAITGASAGVGKATAIAFARQGADIALIARDSDRLEQTAADIKAAGAGETMACSVDISDFDALDKTITEIEENIGPIDVWINSAMTTVFSPVSEIKPEEVKRVTEVTYLGSVHGAMIAVKRMKPRNSGVIVQVGSALAYRAIPLQSAYCGAKHAIRGFIDSLRCELIHDGSDIHVTTVLLPAVNTPQFTWCRSHLDHQPQPLPPIYSPYLIGEAIAWASRQRRREITIGSSSAMAIMGSKFAPGIGDRFLAREAYEEQMTDQEILRDRPDNLFNPVPGEFGVTGQFDETASQHSLHIWATQHLPFPPVVDTVAGIISAAKHLPGIIKAAAR